MDRAYDVKEAVMRELERLGIQPYKPINLELLGYPLVAQGYSQAEIITALHSLIDTDIIRKMPGNRVRLVQNR